MQRANFKKPVIYMEMRLQVVWEKGKEQST